MRQRSPPLGCRGRGQHTSFALTKRNVVSPCHSNAPCWTAAVPLAYRAIPQTSAKDCCALFWRRSSGACFQGIAARPRAQEPGARPAAPRSHIERTAGQFGDGFAVGRYHVVEESLHRTHLAHGAPQTLRGGYPCPAGAPIALFMAIKAIALLQCNIILCNAAGGICGRVRPIVRGVGVGDCSTTRTWLWRD